MARPKKSDEETEISPENGEKIEETPKEVALRDNPYLTEEQKSVLVDYELKNLLKNVRVSKENPTLFEFDSGIGRKMYYIAEVTGPDVEKAWEFYKKNVAGATPAAFFELIAALRPVLYNCRTVSFVKLV